MNHIGKNAHAGEYIGREEYFFYKVGVAGENIRRFQQGRGEPNPGQQTTKEKECVWSISLPSWRSEYHGKNKTVYQQKEKGIEQRPEESQHRAAIACLELPRNQALDEYAVAKKGFYILYHFFSYSISIITAIIAQFFQLTITK
jgi:hypothetical protein